MSRILMIAVLGILLGLLAVMANIVNPKPAPPPTPAQQKQAQEVQKEAQKTALSHEKEERKKMAEQWKKRNEMLAKQNPGAEIKPTAPGKPPEVQIPPSPMAMDISGDWYKATPDGEKGLAELARIQKEREAAAKKAPPVNPQPAPASVLRP